MTYGIQKYYRRKEALSDSGTAAEFRKRYQRDEKKLLKLLTRKNVSKTRLRQLRDELLGHFSDAQNLYLALKHIGEKGGDAAGPDGIRPSWLLDDGSTAYEFLRELATEITDETYEPGPVRIARIGKPGKPGQYRKIQIACVKDRVVSTAIYRCLLPLLDRLFLPSSYGFRPKLGVEDAQIEAAAHAADERGILISHDIRDAFDNVPRKRLLDLVHNVVPEKMYYVIESLIGGPDGRGIPQGSALSPLLLNLYLHHCLDLPWEQDKSLPPMIRYADDILLLCRSQAEAEIAEERLRRLLKSAGMPLKASPNEAIVDLAAGGSVCWLGFEVKLEGEDLTWAIRPEAFDKLAVELARCKRGTQDRKAAWHKIQGWMRFFALAFPKGKARVYALDSLEKVVNDLGLGLSRKKLRDNWRRFYDEATEDFRYGVQCRKRELLQQLRTRMKETLRGIVEKRKLKERRLIA